MGIKEFYDKQIDVLSELELINSDDFTIELINEKRIRFTRVNNSDLVEFFELSFECEDIPNSLIIQYKYIDSNCEYKSFYGDISLNVVECRQAIHLDSNWRGYADILIINSNKLEKSNLRFSNGNKSIEFARKIIWGKIRKNSDIDEFNNNSIKRLKR